jgi:endonuclease/exonuclease/phosphatase family metal-dependent hydrolase
MLKLDHSSRATEKEVHSFTVASYNIHACVGTDGRRDPGRIARVILELDAQVIGLQEVDSKSGGGLEDAQMDYLAEATGLKAVAGPTVRRADSRYGNALLSSYPIAEIRLVDLSVTGSEPRGAIDARLDIQGQIVRFIATHLGLTASERSDQVKRLQQILNEEREQPVILLGDTNEWFPLSRTIQSLHRIFGKTPAKSTFPSWFPLLPLDRIWVRPKGALASVRVHKSPLAKVASDHLPLKVGIALGQTGRGKVVVLSTPKPAKKNPVAQNNPA